MSSYNRRSIIIEEMKALDKSAVNCRSCDAPCCTFLKNSMRVTPLEAKELYEYLVAENMWTEELVVRLQENIKEFRLDSTLLMGKRNSFRRTYTCPFFKHESLGCPIDPTSKPYGCLAFNPTQENVKSGEGCESNLGILERREKLDEEEESINKELREKLNLYWDKESIPVALLDIDKALSK